MNKTLAVLGVAVTLSGIPALASPRDDSPRGRVDRIVERVVGTLKHLLHLAPNDGLEVPRP